MSMEATMSLFNQLGLVKDQVNAAERHEGVPAEVKGMLHTICVGVGRCLEDALDLDKTLENHVRDSKAKVERLEAKVKKLQARINELEIECH